MKKEVKKYPIIRNPELVQAVKGFVPVFGSEEDLHIVNAAFDLDKLLATVDNEAMRSGNPKRMTPTMKRVLERERLLISSITRRNMDF